MEYEAGKIIIQYDRLENKEYVIGQLEKLGLKIDKAFRYTPQVAVRCESLSKSLEQEIMSIELDGQAIVEHVNKVGIIRNM